MSKNKTLIIAEAGVNHNGKLILAKKLVDASVSAGADIVKFQTFKTENLLTKKAPKADYQKKNTNKNKSQFEIIKKLELSYDDHYKLVDYCKYKKIEFLSSPMDIESIIFLKKLKLKKLKIPSGEINNYIYLSEISKFKGDIILSTGMANLNDIRNALKILIDGGVKKNNITILHCNTEYPTPYADVNLNAMLEIKNKLNVKIGYSDHSIGLQVPLMAKILGASVIEKHITLDKNLDGPDHKTSLNPKEFKNMVDQINRVDIILGNKNKKISKSEKKNIKIARKSIVARSSITIGEKFSLINLTAKRPANGISPMKIPLLIGKKSKKNYKVDQLININEIK